MNDAYLHKHIIRQIRINYGLFSSLVLVIMIFSFNMNKKPSLASVGIVFVTCLSTVILGYFVYYRPEKKAFKEMLEKTLG